MKSKLRILIAVSLLLAWGCCLTVLAANAKAAKEKLAVEAAKKWLALVDNGKYGASWDEAASFFKSNISKAEWEQKVKPVREPFGKVLSRKLKSTKYATALPGAPDGEYVMIQFDTQFAKKKTSIETITPMLDKDGKWRVSGYYIK